MDSIMRVARLAFELLVTVFEVALWLLHGVRQLALITWDAARGLWAYYNGMWCPEGHAFGLSGDDLPYDFQCSACGWRWSGRLGNELRCPNVECEAPNAPFVACPTCGLSVRNPFRWGRL